MNPKTSLILILLAFLSVPTILVGKDHQRIIEIIELGIQENFPAALELVSQLEKEMPDDLWAHFIRASVLQSMMMDLETNRWRDAFFTEISLAVSLSDSLLKINPNDAQALLFRGAALSYKGLQLSREKKYLSGIQTSIKGINALEQALDIDSTLIDAYLAIGSYKYWRSYLTRHFTWLPFFADQRDEGIELIERAYFKGSFSKWAALSNLGWIYIQEERFEEAIRCAQEGLTTFPSSRFFLWLLAEALFKNRQHRRAAEVYQTLLESVVAEEINNHYNEILLHLKLAQCFYAEQSKEQAIYHARRVLQIVPDDEVKERVRTKKQTAEKLLHELAE